MTQDVTAITNSIVAAIIEVKARHHADNETLLSALGDIIVGNAGFIDLKTAERIAASIHFRVYEQWKATQTRRQEQNWTPDTAHDLLDTKYRLEAEAMGDIGDPVAVDTPATATINTLRDQALSEPMRIMAAHAGASSWLTVGDGRFGEDARQLAAMGAQDVTASDICDTALKRAHELGLLTKYSKENAEQLSFANGHFDYVLCRDSYHHMPRAPLALYEMLRVARQGVVLIEPQDPGIDPPMLFSDTERLWFEAGGNFVYSLSRRELLKMAHGLSLHSVALKNVNDYWKAEFGRAPAVEGEEPYETWKRRLARYDRLCREGKASPVYLFAILFKHPPAPDLTSALEQNGWDVSPVLVHPSLVKALTGGQDQRGP